MEQSVLSPGVRAQVSRRRFLGFSAVAAAAALAPTRVVAATSVKRPAPERTLSFFNTHTGERLKTAYCCGGEYQPEALNQINHILRDFRANEVKSIDPQLLDLLHELGGTLETDRPFHIISGYRSPRTNAMLRDQRRRGDGRRVTQPPHGRESDRYPTPRREARRPAPRGAFLEAGRRRLLSRVELRPRRYRSRAILVGRKESKKKEGRRKEEGRKKKEEARKKIRSALSR